jgi:hypothetical protein
MRRSMTPRAASAAGAGHPAHVSPHKSPAARPISEHQLQVQVAAYLDSALPTRGCFWTSIDSAGRGAIAGAHMKRRGVKRGTADIMIVSDHRKPSSTIWVELKSATGRLTPEQKIFRDCVEQAGHLYMVARSVETVAIMLVAAGLRLRGRLT